MSLIDELPDIKHEAVNPNSYNAVWEVMFYSRAVKATAAEVARGLPAYRDVDYVKMQPRAVTMPTTIYDRAVDFEGLTHTDDATSYRLPDDKRFPYEWAIYKNQNSDRNQGLSLDFADFLSKADVALYHDKNIKSVEQLANLHAESISQLGGKTSGHVIKAKEFLEKHANLQLVASVVEESRSVKEANETLARQLEELKQQMLVLTQDNASVKKDLIATRGRPKKTAEFEED